MLALGLVVTGVVAGGAGAALQANPTGSYQAFVSGQAPAVNGRWVIKLTTTFGPAGKFQSFRNGRLAAAGTTAWTGNKVTFVDQTGSYACKGTQRAGIYTFSRPAPNKLRFTTVVDLCTGRKTLLGGRTFTKLSP
jgi:hypothetical protein